MRKTFIGLIWAASFFSLQCQNIENRSNESDRGSQEANLCLIISDPETYKSKVVQLKAKFYGYHGLVLYDEDCCEKDKIVIVHELKDEIRRQMRQTEENLEVKRKSADFIGTVTILGKLEENDVGPIYATELKPKYKFTIFELKNYEPAQSIANSCVLKHISTRIKKK